MPAPLYIVLLHHPVLNRDGVIVTTAITNIDVHDIARSARTYGLAGFFVAHPILGMRRLTERILWHWREGHGATYNPSRGEALALVRIATDLDQVLVEIERETGTLPVLISTSARPDAAALDYREMHARLERDERPHLVVLGTGYGLTPEVLERCELRLAPILGASDYNHLSVRAAAAIMLDRLAGH
ncbi:MAG: RNA methyltransferase [Deltaproteobacteria bacterium]